MGSRGAAGAKRISSGGAIPGGIGTSSEQTCECAGTYMGTGIGT